eukprot:3041013-Pleurochrysis_carterae.AAC.3
MARARDTCSPPLVRIPSSSPRRGEWTAGSLVNRKRPSCTEAVLLTSELLYEVQRSLSKPTPAAQN